jgi:hypothetical protein
VDYLFDWARDVYREVIISELRSLAADNTTSLGNNSDVFSLEDRVAFWPQLPRVQEESDDEVETSTKPNMTVGAITQDPLKAFDSPYGVLRYARYIRSRFMALYITEDNLSVLMKSVKTPEKARKAAETIFRCPKDSFRVCREALDALELKWTGKDCENMSLYSPKKVFLVITTVSAYLSPDWEQTRELCFLAVSEGVMEELSQYANLKNNDSWLSSRFPWVAEEPFFSGFEMYLTVAVKDNLLAAISRACVSTKLFAQKPKTKTTDGRKLNTWWLASVEDIPGNIKYQFDAAIMPDSQAYTRGFISSIYNPHKIGRNEPSSSILRISDRLDEQTRPIDFTTKSVWPALDLSAASIGTQQDVIFVASMNPGNVSQYAELCCFLMDTPGMKNFIDQETLEQPNMASLYTMRMDTKPGWGGGWNRANLQMHDVNFEENKQRLLNHFSKPESFTYYRKGKGVARTSPTKLMKLKKEHQNWERLMLRPTSFPESYPEIMNFRDMLTREGNRITSITDNKQYGPNAETGMARVGSYTIPENGGSALSPLDLTGNNLPQRSRSTLNLGKPGSTIIGFTPGGDIHDPDNSQETSSASTRGNIDHSFLSCYMKEIGAERVEIPDEQFTQKEKGKGGAVSSPKLTPLPLLHHHPPKRPLNQLDPETASSSAGPSKRPRQENQSQFGSDYLDDEELSFLLESGGFVE